MLELGKSLEIQLPTVNAMILSLTHARRNLTFLTEEFRGVVIHTPVGDEALEDLNCVLQIGIQGFESLILADQQNLARLSSNGNNDSHEMNQASIQGGCVMWLETANEINTWVKGCSDISQLTELKEFRKCLEEMKAIVSFFEGEVKREIPAWILSLRDTALQEHNHEQTQPLIQTEK